MTRLLHIESSPRKKRSASIEVARAYCDAFCDMQGDPQIDVLNLFSVALPELDGDILDAKYADLGGVALSEDQEIAWTRVRELAQRLHDADVLVFSVPLWNFAIPYKLKHFIDLVSQRNILFTFNGASFEGLLRGKRAIVVYARGLDYSAQSSTAMTRIDYQRSYMDAWLSFVGVTDVKSVIVEKTLCGPEIDHAARAVACKEAAALTVNLPAAE